MKINIMFSPVNKDELYFTGRTTVVIDVLRASTTIITALSNGAKEVIPVATVEFAIKVSGGMFGGHTLLGGERNAQKIEGFALGNSPSEYEGSLIEDKSIVYYTTNGSKAIVKAKFSEELLICAFSNLTAVAEHLANLGKDVEILCAGNNNLFSMEDSVCAGRLVKELMSIKDNVELSDSAKCAVALNQSFGKNIFKMLKDTEHGKLLGFQGFENDLKVCSKFSITNTVPLFNGNALHSIKV
ncbi:MAG: 2-phosphosulfolactate phosphatase [Ignavibacteriaceae bacterium]|nr:2-phosphosulfolactate phosphatase [Ignavibacteriaceae bacterium]